MSQKQIAGNGKLEVGHVHQLIRLLIEARGFPAGQPERGQHLVSGVARIVGAAAGISVLHPDLTPNGDRPVELILVGADSAVLRCVFQSMMSVMMRITPREPGATVTVTWDELVTDRRWCEPDRVAQHLHSIGIADALLSSLRLRSPFHVHGLGLYRERESLPFSEEERNLVHVFHAACEVLLYAPPRGGGGGGGGGDESVRGSSGRLSPRQCQALELVLSGLCDKEIAECLGISRHTVNQYTKAIYRHYGVTSRAQLLARMLAQPQSVHP